MVLVVEHQLLHQIQAIDDFMLRLLSCKKTLVRLGDRYWKALLLNVIDDLIEETSEARAEFRREFEERSASLAASPRGNVNSVTRPAV